MHTASGSLSPVPPFDLSLSLRFLEGFTPAEGEQAIADGAITKGATPGRQNDRGSDLGGRSVDRGVPAAVLPAVVRRAALPRHEATGRDANRRVPVDRRRPHSLAADGRPGPCVRAGRQPMARPASGQVPHAVRELLLGGARPADPDVRRALGQGRVREALRRQPRGERGRAPGLPGGGRRGGSRGRGSRPARSEPSSRVLSRQRDRGLAGRGRGLDADRSDRRGRRLAPLDQGRRRVVGGERTGRA